MIKMCDIPLCLQKEFSNKNNSTCECGKFICTACNKNLFNGTWNAIKTVHKTQILPCYQSGRFSCPFCGELFPTSMHPK